MDGSLLQLLEKKENGTALVQELKFIRERARELLSTIVSLHPEFTPHTIEHKDEVIKIYSKIFPKSLLEALKKHELFFLIAATYLHHIGMGELAALGDIPANHADKATLIRDTHHLRTEKYINKSPSTFHTSPSQAYIIGRICAGHRKGNLDDVGLFKFEYPFDYETVNIPLLASMLKLADELDMTNVRTPKIILENITLSNIVSADEWNKQLSIDGIASIENGSVIKCSGRTSNPKIFRLIKEAEHKINELLIQMPRYLDGYLSYNRELPHRFVVDIGCEASSHWTSSFFSIGETL